MAHHKTVTRNMARMNGASQGCDQFDTLATRPGGELRLWQMLPEDSLGHSCGCSFVMAALHRGVSRLDRM